MIKKVLIFVTILVVVIIGATAIAMEISHRERISRYETKIKAVAEYTGMEYIGLINPTDISRRNGCLFDGPAIHAELLRMAGLDENSDTWTSMVKELGDDCLFYRLTVFEEGQENVLLRQKKVKAEYLYGEIF